MNPRLITTQGALARDELGLILPHEHAFVDLGPPDENDWRDANPADVVDLIGPEIEAAMDAGVTALVECTPEGVGRRPDVDVAVSEATGLPIVLPTGIYQEPYVPEWAIEADEDDLRDWMIEELTESAGETGVRAAWIKVSASDDGMTDVEEKILRAAARAGAETGALIGSHTVDADVVHEQLDVVEAVGYDPERFVWIHAQAERDVERHLEVARRGAWIEYDWIGDEPDDDYYVEAVQRLIDAGFEDRLLLSQDRGWYDASEPGGGDPDPYTYLPETFLPRLREAGIDEGTVRRLTRDNPFEAFAR